MHGYIQCTDVHAKETSRKRRYVVEYEDDSPNDVVRYHQYQNLDLLISQSTKSAIISNEIVRGHTARASSRIDLPAI